MKTRFFKAKTPITINYITVVNGLCFVVRKNNANNWRIYAYKDTLVGTDNYIRPITSEYFHQKKYAVNRLLEVLKTTETGFYHNIKNT